jgi:ligand-binding sensor domain-containing protein
MFNIIRKSLLASITILICFSFSGQVSAQESEWLNYTSGTGILGIVQEGEYLWVGGGGLNKLNIITGENINYNAANSGLSVNDVTAISLDKLGNKWIGTVTGGLLKYDGTNWTIFDDTNSPLLGQITDIVVDSSNAIWIGTVGFGIYKFDGTNWINYKENNSGLPNNYIHCLEIEGNNLWAGVNNNLVKFDGSIWILFNNTNSCLTGETVNSLAIDSSGTKWIGTYILINGYRELKVIKFNDTTCVSFDLPGNYVKDIVIDTEGNVWCAAGILCKIKNNQITYPNVGGGDKLFLDDLGNIWIGGGGLTKYDGINISSYKVGNSDLPENRIMSIFIDKNNNKWIGLESLGVCKFDGFNWTTFPMFGAVTAINEDNEGNIWIGSEGGVGKYNGIDMTIYDITNSGLPNNVIRDIKIDPYGDKWFATWGGLAIYDDTNWTVFNTSNSSIPSNFLSEIQIDQNENLWIGYQFYGGITKFDGYNWRTYIPGIDMPDLIEVHGLLFDKDNNLWVGGRCNYVVKYDGINWISYHQAPTSMSIIEDNSGNIWFGTISDDNGLTKYDGTTWINYKPNNSGLSSHYIEALAIDQEGNKWIGTYGGGIAVYTHKDLLMPIPDYPPNNSEDVPLNQIFTWESVPGAETYHLQVAEDNNFSLLKSFNSDNALSLVYEDSTLTDTSTQVPNLQSLQKYYWRTKAKSTNNNSGWSQIWSFTTQSYYSFNSNTGNNATISIPVSINPSINDVPLEAGDQIAAFTPSGLCVGAIVWDVTDNVLVVWRDNDQTPEVDGIQVGEQIKLRIWQNSSNTEFTQTEVNYSLGDGIYTVNGVYILSSLTVTNTSITEDRKIPIEISLRQNYPNPFNSSTMISFDIPNQSNVLIKVYDVLGNEVATIVNEEKQAGSYNITFDASALSNGVYFYRLQAGSYIETKKMILMK